MPAGPSKKKAAVEFFGGGGASGVGVVRPDSVFAAKLSHAMSDQDLIDAKYFLRTQSAGGLVRRAHGIELTLAPGEERLRVEVLRADLLRLKISRGGRFDEQPTLAVVDGALAALGGGADFTVEDTPEAVRVVTPELTLTVGKAPFRLDAHRADGSPVFESAENDAYATLNDEFLLTRRRQREDAFYGLGEKTGRFNRAGSAYTLWNTDVLNPNVLGAAQQEYGTHDPRADPRGTVFDPYYVSIPFFYHQRHLQPAMAGFFLDNPYRARFDFQADEEFTIRFLGGQYTEYVFAGPRMAGILAAYTALTGRMQVPPLWALGYHQCRWFAYTQKTTLELAARHREQDFPCDSLWLDIDYMDGYRVFTWNPDAFPDPSAMLAALRAQGFRVITIIDPGVKHEPGYRVFDEAREQDLLCRTQAGEIYVGQVWPGRTAFPDFSLAAARAWWGRLNAAHVQSGLAGIWNDMNEPATGDIPCEAMHFGGGTVPHAQFHNQYATLMAMGTVEGLLAARPDQRTFVLSRAGSPGIQRYAANWLGDNCSRWEHLGMSLPMAAGFGVSGQPFVGADVGGFMENTTPELLVRWYQYGALTPFCRNHNCNHQNDQYPWVFGEAVEALCRRAIERRYRLMPYLYAAFLEASETGAPVQRPLVFDYQDDLGVRAVDDQFLLGRDLLVAPVYQPGQTARLVYLPAGTWYDQEDGTHAGPAWITAPAPLDTIPCYVRAGSVVPMWPEAPPSTMGYHPASIELHVFIPEADGETRSFLHEDDGETFALRAGAFYRTEFVLRREGGAITLAATVTGAGYPAFARREFTLVFHGRSLSPVSVDGQAVTVARDRVTLADAGTGFLLCMGG